jgi:hypothetical protein
MLTRKALSSLQQQQPRPYVYLIDLAILQPNPGLSDMTETTMGAYSLLPSHRAYEWLAGWLAG